MTTPQPPASPIVPTPIAASESLATFEGLMKALIDRHTDGRDWQQHTWPPGTMISALRQSLSPTKQLPSWRLINSLLHQLGAPESSYTAFHAAYERAKLYRPWSDTVRISHADDQAGTYVINNTGGTIHLHSERRYSRRAERLAEPAIPDAPGYDLKPDPFTARSVAELEELAREFWRWVDKPSSRHLAERSGGAFSHATIARIIYEKPGRPALTMQYLIGLIRGCGGDAQEQQRWASAWRLLDRANRANSAQRTKPELVWPPRAG
ncbi:hypothetical protein ACBR40_45745 [Nonomuraea sp. AD125B]|uniref:hypothetical protein n=1 Tax=Nonomuraea sp. AD125B TaxID=3242897 RepID=UPI00352972CF